MPIPTYTPNYGYARLSTLMFPTVVPTTVTTAAAVTYTATEILNGFILRNPNGAARSDLFPTAAAIVAAIEGCAANTAFYFDIRNTAGAAETITMTTNTGLTLSGTMTIAQSNSKRFLAIVTTVTKGSEAVVINSLGTTVT